MTTKMYQGRQILPSANRKKRSNLRGFVAGIAMNMATTIRVCPQKKKMHETQTSEVEKDENEERTASA
jgi:hypothetical protein